MHQIRHRRGSTVAFIAALVLVLQSVLGAWATGAMAATPMLDAFGNPLCITSVDDSGKNPASDHSHLPDCCTLGCSMVSSFLAAGSSGNSVGLPQPLSSANVLFALVADFHIQAPDHDPGSPRAPPLTA